MCVEAVAKDLSKVLASEIKYEKEILDAEPFSSELMTSFLKTSGFKLSEKPNDAMLILTKQEGDVSVAVLCDVRQSYLDEGRYNEEDEADLEEEADDKGHHQEDAKPDIGKDDVEDGDDESNPIIARIEVTKKSVDKRLVFDVTFGPHYVNIMALSVAPKDAIVPSEPTVAFPPTTASAPFLGPNFYDLSEDMADAFNDYLVALGVNGEMYEALQEQIAVKEHKEYTSWLSNLQGFFSK